jgi:hypothetical protein
VGLIDPKNIPTLFDALCFVKGLCSGATFAYPFRQNSYITKEKNKKYSEIFLRSIQKYRNVTPSPRRFMGILGSITVILFATAIAIWFNDNVPIGEYIQDEVGELPRH